MVIPVFQLNPNFKKISTFSPTVIVPRAMPLIQTSPTRRDTHGNFLCHPAGCIPQRFPDSAPEPVSCFFCPVSQDSHLVGWRVVPTRWCPFHCPSRPQLPSPVQVSFLKPSLIRLVNSCLVVLLLSHFIACAFFLVIVCEGPAVAQPGFTAHPSAFTAAYQGLGRLMLPPPVGMGNPTSIFQGSHTCWAALSTCEAPYNPPVAQKRLGAIPFPLGRSI